MSLIAFHAPLGDALLDGVADTVAAGLAEVCGAGD